MQKMHFVSMSIRYKKNQQIKNRMKFHPPESPSIVLNGNIRRKNTKVKAITESIEYFLEDASQCRKKQEV